MEKFHKYNIIAILAGIVLFILSIPLHISWLGILSYFIFVAGILCLLFTTKIGLAIFISGGILTFFALLIYFGPIQLVSATQDLVFYYNNKDSVAEVDAIVTDIVENPSGDGGSDYNAYISYTYNNTEYSNIYWKMVDRNYQINSKIKISIYSEKPNQILENASFYYITLIFPILITIFLIIAMISLPLTISKEIKAKKSQQQTDAC